MDTKKQKEEIALGWPLRKNARDRTNFFLQNIDHLSIRARFNFLNATTFSDSSHLLTIARTGSGKGVSSIIPTLLSYSGPIITIDPKGENFFVTAEYRKKVLGHNVYAIDPFNVIRDRDHALSGYPVSGINIFEPSFNQDGPQKMHDSTSIARMMTNIDPAEQKEPYWQNSAEALLTGIIHLVLTNPRFPKENRNLAQVMSIIMKPDMDEFLKRILETDSKYQIDPYARSQLSIYSQNGESQKDIIKSIARSNISLLHTEEIEYSLSSANINIDEIKNGEDFSIYIVMPPEKLSSHARVFSMITVTLLNLIMQRKKIPDCRTLFLLDECAQFGTLEELRRAVTLLRGFGLQVWMFFQDLSQLESLYEDWQSLIHNCGALQIFGLGRLSDALPISNIIGHIQPEDLLKLDRSQQVLSFAGGYPRIFRRLNYLEDPILSSRAGKNPYYENTITA